MEKIISKSKFLKTFYKKYKEQLCIKFTDRVCNGITDIKFENCVKFHLEINDFSALIKCAYLV